ncbi:MAG: nickel-dependent hydrogenase large subunit [bacterium]
MARNVTIDPITRIEGHLAIRVETELNRVSQAFCSGEMFRGFEVILRGRDPLDAQQITQRICGVCPVSHGVASILAQDMAYGVVPPRNGRLVRNLILGANYIQSHLIHFYHLSALDFVDIAAVTGYQGSDPQLREVKAWIQSQQAANVMYPGAPFLPRYSGKYLADTDSNILAVKHYLEALEMRALAHRMGAIFAGKLPHAATLVPGGVTEKVTVKQIVDYQSKLNTLRTFIDECYLADVEAVAAAFPEYLQLGKGCGNFLAYGVFSETTDPSVTFLPSGTLIGQNLMGFDARKITEDVQYSLFSSPSSLPPSEGQTIPAPHKQGAYSWLKAPRYGGQVMEVGPLARMLVAYHKGNPPQVKQVVDGVLARLGGKPEDLVSVLGRHAARAIECKIVADQCAQWVEQLVPDESTFKDFTIPEAAEGVGLTEAPRGALGHWIEIRDHKIERYQCVVPTTWNCSPRDDQGNPGAIEQALTGIPIEDEENPIEAARVVRSFDPCLACAVH